MKFLILTIVFSSSMVFAMGSKPEGSWIEHKKSGKLNPESIQHPTCTVYVLINQSKLRPGLSNEEKNLLFTKGYTPIEISDKDFEAKQKPGVLYMTLSHINFPIFVYLDKNTKQMRSDYSTAWTHSAFSRIEYNEEAKEYFNRPLSDFVIDTKALHYSWTSVLATHFEEVSKLIPSCSKQ